MKKKIAPNPYVSMTPGQLITHYLSDRPNHRDLLQVAALAGTSLRWERDYIKFDEFFIEPTSSHTPASAEPCIGWEAYVEEEASNMDKPDDSEAVSVASSAVGLSPLIITCQKLQVKWECQNMETEGACPTCFGSGIIDGNEASKCEACGGSGWTAEAMAKSDALIIKIKQLEVEWGRQHMVVEGACPTCSSFLFFVKNGGDLSKCEACGGSGWTNEGMAEILKAQQQHQAAAE